MCARELSWRPEDSLLELVLSVHHMVSELELRSTWVVRLGGECLCLLGRVASPSPVFPKGVFGSAQNPIFAVLVFLKTGSCCVTQEPLNLLCNSGHSVVVLLPQPPKSGVTGMHHAWLNLDFKRNQMLSFMDGAVASQPLFTPTVVLLLLPVVQSPFPGRLGLRRCRGNDTDSERVPWKGSLL